MRKTLLCVLPILLSASLLFLRLAETSSAASEGLKISVVYTDWYPYTYFRNGEHRGFEIEICQAVFRRMNVAVQFINYPWKRCLASLEHGEADALVSLLRTPDREEYTCFPNEPISVSHTSIACLAESDISFSGSLKDLETYRIGVIAGFSYGEEFDKSNNTNKDFSNDTGILLTKLIRGRTDLVIENKAVLSAYAANMGVRDKITFLSPPVHTQNLYVGFSKAKYKGVLCEEFSKALAEFKNTSEYHDILVRYGVE